MRWIISVPFSSAGHRSSRHSPFTLMWERAAIDAQRRVLGPANTRFNNYLWTVAADDAEGVRDRPSLYELAEIDRDRHTVVGIELNVDGSTTVTVYAIDRIGQIHPGSGWWLLQLVAYAMDSALRPAGLRDSGVGAAAPTRTLGGYVETCAAAGRPTRNLSPVGVLRASGCRSMITDSEIFSREGLVSYRAAVASQMSPDE
jgi:hypothetical protein